MKNFPIKTKQKQTQKERAQDHKLVRMELVCVCFALVLLSIDIVGFDDVQPRQMTFDSQRVFRWIQLVPPSIA